MTIADQKRDLIQAKGIGRDFEGPAGRLQVLDGLDLAVSSNEIVAIVGASGSGKSTLLHILGCLDRPTRGSVAIEGRDTGRMADRELARIRNNRIGFVFQFHHLLPEFTALENAGIPLLVAGQPVGKALARSQELLEQVGLKDRMQHKPTELSGGEQQRVAIARALAARPAVLLADEPTGDLDARMGGAIIDLLWQLKAGAGISMVIVTHNREVAARADRVLELREGRLWPA